MIFEPKGIIPVRYSEETGEPIYTIEDALHIVGDVSKDPYYTVWGGDILDSSFEYTYDNWHYDGDVRKSSMELNQESCIYASNYLKNYISRNGISFYVILVIGSGLNVVSCV